MLDKNKKSMRLTGYDYSMPGYYFITICTHEMQYFFGECADGIMKLNKFGEIVKNELLKTPKIRPGIILDEFTIMPNHIHVITVITDSGKLPLFPAVGIDSYQSLQNRYGPQYRNLFSIIRGFKGATTKQINILRDALGNPVWQTRFYDHIIRDKESLINIREYIKNNPANWERDSKNHENFSNELKDILKKK